MLRIPLNIGAIYALHVFLNMVRIPLAKLNPEDKFAAVQKCKMIVGIPALFLSLLAGPLGITDRKVSDDCYIPKLQMLEAWGALLGALLLPSITYNGWKSFPADEINEENVLVWNMKFEPVQLHDNNFVEPRPDPHSNLT